MESASSVFRLIIDPPRPAALNMAIDEILMDAQKTPAALPSLRFYSWSSPAYSLGYFQDVREVAARRRAAGKNIPVVRRITGGGMVLHGKDLTFSLTLKSTAPFLPREVKGSYLRINEALRSGLAELLPEIDYASCKDVPSGRADGERVCFEAPSCYDLLLGRKKVVGSSQRRKDGAVLHQASLFFDLDRETMIDRISRGFEKQWGIFFREIPLSDEELLRAEQRAEERYASPEWAYQPLTV
ncbi:MAG: lipoate--protein ligase family protein [Candidatus Omnitrophica bacterium]|nr:lipoate--protein ligase family protein [Candidatus Omnitrophota bacterium]